MFTRNGKKHMVNFKKFIGFLSLFLCVGCFYQDETLFDKGFLESWLEGYSEDNISAIQKDLTDIRDLTFRKHSSVKLEQPTYLATAGGPGAKKSTVLETLLNTQAEYESFVYIDPDQRALKFMTNTYISKSLNLYTVSLFENFREAQKEAYDKWRNASNYIANTLLSSAALGKYNIAHGTTLTGSKVDILLSRIKKLGYKIVLVLCGAKDSLRQQAIKYRTEVQGFYQTEPQDIISKGLLFPLRMSTYFTYADELMLYWSRSIMSPSILGAKIDLTKKKIHITNKKAYQDFVQKYEIDRDKFMKKKEKFLKSWVQLTADLH